jgi:hypothetical protein
MSGDSGSHLPCEMSSCDAADPRLLQSWPENAVELVDLTDVLLEVVVGDRISPEVHLLDALLPRSRDGFGTCTNGQPEVSHSDAAEVVGDVSCIRIALVEFPVLREGRHQDR